VAQSVLVFLAGATAGSYRKYDPTTLVQDGIEVTFPASPQIVTTSFPVTDPGAIYASSHNNDVLFRLDYPSETLTRNTISGDAVSNPSQLVADDDDLWLPISSPDAIVKYDKATLTASTSVATDHSRRAVYVDPYIWLWDNAPLAVKVIDPSAGTVVTTQTVKTGSRTPGASVHYNGHVYVAERLSGTGGLYKVDDSTYSLVTERATFRSDAMVEIGGDLYAVLENNGDFVKVDASTLSTTATISGSYVARALAHNGVDTIWLADDTLDELHKIDLGTFSVIETGALGTIDEVTAIVLAETEAFTPGPRGLGGWGVGETKDEQW